MMAETETQNEPQIINAPEAFNSTHDTASFNCRSERLNDWLKESALKFEGETARTYVVTAGKRVIAYYCLSTAVIDRKMATNKIKQNSPSSIPCILIGRLATDCNWERKGIGSGLLKDAYLRILEAEKIVGIKALIVDVLDQDAKEFYIKNGFIVSPIEPRKLMMSIKDIKASLLEASKA